MTNKQSIATEIFGSIEWKDEDTGFVQCPGKELHSQKTKKHDTILYLSGAPGAFCFHQSCAVSIASANLKLRRALAGIDRPEPHKMTAQEVQQMRQQMSEKKTKTAFDSWLEHWKTQVLAHFPWSPALAWQESPVDLSENPKEDWRRHLSLFDCWDTVWIGAVEDSGREKNKRNFRSVNDWLADGPAGNFTTGSVFRTGTFSRSNENVLQRPFLVVESDELDQNQICSIFKWCRRFMRLRAIVFTGGKSLHGWFDFPSNPVLEKMKVALPAMGCDRALFKPSQPVRLAGVFRKDKNQMQSLFYLDNNQ